MKTITIIVIILYALAIIVLPSTSTYAKQLTINSLAEPSIKFLITISPLIIAGALGYVIDEIKNRREIK